MNKKKVIDIDKFMDRVFLHNKNADERLWDFILRSATFFILIIIILMSGLNAHADGINVTSGTMEFTTLSEYATLPASDVLLTFDKIIENLNDKDITTTSVPQGTFYTNYTAIKQYDYITDEFLNNLPLPTNVSGNNISANGMNINIPTLTLDNNDFYVYITDISSSHFTYYVNFIFPEYQWKYGYSEVVYNYENDYEWSNFYAFRYYVVIDYDVSNGTWSAGLGADRYDNNSARCPVFSNGIVWYAYDGVNGVIANNFQENLQSPTTLCCDLNYVHYNNLIGSGNIGESNKNHLYFKDVQVGITCTSANQDIVSSQVVVGVSVDDWVLNHINDYYVFCQYTFHMKDSYTGSADPNFTVTKVVPLNAFMNDGYCYSVYDLWQEGNFINYYNMINSTYKVKVRSKYETFNKGLMPTLVNWVTYGFADYYLDSIDHIENAYEVFDFGLDVNVILSNGALGGGDNTSKPYTKAFDFLRGSASVTNAEGLRNHNPWTGESDPQANPIIPNGGGSSNGNGDGATAIAYGGNVNVTINNGLGGNPNDVTDNPSPTESIQEYLSAINDMKDSVNEFLVEDEVEGKKTFILFLKDTLDGFPGMEEMVNVIRIIIGVCIIIIVIKLLLSLV